MDLSRSLAVSASGMRSQSERLRTIAENLANAGSTAQTPGGEPYRRKIVTFGEELDREMGARLVQVDGVLEDKASFERRLEPGHPAADENGYVLLPNVNPLVELMDMRESQRSYEANMGTLQAARTLLTRTIDLLRG